MRKMQENKIIADSLIKIEIHFACEKNASK
jgi:hypothetical protein